MATLLLLIVMPIFTEIVGSVKCILQQCDHPRSLTLVCYFILLINSNRGFILHRIVDPATLRSPDKSCVAKARDLAISIDLVTLACVVLIQYHHVRTDRPIDGHAKLPTIANTPIRRLHTAVFC